jgi:hypothetical protein
VNPPAAGRFRGKQVNKLVIRTGTKEPETINQEP